VKNRKNFSQDSWCAGWCCNKHPLNTRLEHYHNANWLDYLLLILLLSLLIILLLSSLSSSSSSLSL